MSLKSKEKLPNDFKGLCRMFRSRKCFLFTQIYLLHYSIHWVDTSEKSNFWTQFHSFIGIWKEGNWVLKFQCGNSVCFIELGSWKVVLHNAMQCNVMWCNVTFHWVWKLESSGKANSKASSTQLNSLNWWPSYLLSIILCQSELWKLSPKYWI